MKRMRRIMIAAALVAVTSLGAVRAHAGLFKLDFSTLQNLSESVTLTNWDMFSDWSFTDFPGGIATWKLTDWSADNNTNVTLTITDNAPLAARLGFPPASGMGGNNVTAVGLAVVYDGIDVPAVVKDDYMGRGNDTPGTELLFRFANLSPGRYNVTVFLGRPSDDNGQYGKIWADDASGTHEPAEQNTGDFSGSHVENGVRVPDLQGNPKTITVDIRAGDYLWYAHMEDNQGGISGMIIRSIGPLVDSDGDGLPDYWETQFGLNPNDPADAAPDINGNGISNLMEYKLGLNPTDTTKPVLLSAVADPVLGKVAVTFSKPIFYANSGFVNDPRDSTIATNPANYSISPPLPITGVTVKGNVVTLTTTQQTPSATPYTLTVNHLRDVNNWPVAANAQVQFLISASGPQPLLYQWTTIAGLAGESGADDGTNSAARFNFPWGVELDSAGNLFVADGGNNTIRKLTRDGTNWVTTTIAGLAGQSGGDDGANSAARFNFPEGMVVDSAGNLYVADDGNHTIRKLTQVGTNWVTTTIAGLAGLTGSADGTNSAARFNLPADVALDTAGHLYVSDGNQTIRQLTPEGTNWVTTTIAGLAGQSGSADGTNSAARFYFTYGNGYFAWDRAGNLFLAENANGAIRKLTREGTNWVTTTIAGKGGWPGVNDGTNSLAHFFQPYGIAADSAGNLYVTDDETRIRKITPHGADWVTSSIGGGPGLYGTADGIGSDARFNGTAMIKADRRGNLFVVDVNNNTIRMGVPLLPVFRSVAKANGQIKLTCSTTPWLQVQLQYTSDLSSAAWTNLGSPMASADGTLSATDTPGPDSRRFYRAMVVLP